MIYIDINRFIKDRLWFGFWYSEPYSGRHRWVFERHDAVRLFTVMRLKEAQRLVQTHNESERQFDIGK